MRLGGNTSAFKGPMHGLAFARAPKAETLNPKPETLNPERRWKGGLQFFCTAVDLPEGDIAVASGSFIG